MNFIDEELYFEASNLANKVCNEISKEYDIPIHKVKNIHVKKYMEQVNNVAFIDVNFGNHLDSLLLGSISKVFGEIIISINKTMIWERRLFTCMHEIGNFYFDIDSLNAGNQLTDMISESGYLPDDMPMEFRANVAASVFMANDEALRYAVVNLKSFDKIANYFCISKSALRIRLTEYLIYHENYSPNFSYTLVNDLVYSKGLKFRNFFERKAHAANMD